MGEDPAERQETAPLKKYFQTIFEKELEGWYTDRKTWPQLRDLKTFRQWFEVIRESVVTDLEAGPIEVEEV